jgi:hypothetical protein
VLLLFPRGIFSCLTTRHAPSKSHHLISS